MAGKIRKIKLADGSIYGIFDEGALRLDDQGRLITGNELVDKLVLEGNLVIEVDDVPVEEGITNVLVQDDNTKVIKKRSKDKLLEDIGGISYSEEALEDGVLALKVGKQD